MFLVEAVKVHTSAKGEVEEIVATPVVSLDYFSLDLSGSALGEGTTPTLALCDGNTTYSLGLLVPRKGPVPYAVQRCLRFPPRVWYTRT